MCVLGLEPALRVLAVEWLHHHVALEGQLLGPWVEERGDEKELLDLERHVRVEAVDQVLVVLLARRLGTRRAVTVYNVQAVKTTVVDQA